MRDYLENRRRSERQEQTDLIDLSWSTAETAPGPDSGGRLMVRRSLSLLTLEVYYRYLPLYYRDTGAVATK